MTASASALWLNTVFAGFDLGITDAIHKLFLLAGGFFTPFFRFFSFLCDPVVIVVIALVFVFFKKTRRFGLPFLIAITVGVLLTNGCLKLLVARPRPYTDTTGLFYQFWLEVGQFTESDNSFPSGHATAAFASMTAVFYCWDHRLRRLAYLPAILVAISRIYLCVHYPSDVLVGIIVGLISGHIAVLINKKLPKSLYEFDFLSLKKHWIIFTYYSIIVIYMHFRVIKTSSKRFNYIF